MTRIAPIASFASVPPADAFGSRNGNSIAGSAQPNAG